MTPTLSHELQQAVDRSQGKPIHLEDPRTHKTYVLIDADQADGWLQARGTPPDDWTEAKNARRCELVRKKFAAGLSTAEDAELIELQRAAGEFREQFGPLAAQTARALEAELDRVRKQANGAQR
jgi:hypothetical protein